MTKRNLLSNNSFDDILHIIKEKWNYIFGGSGSLTEKRKGTFSSCTEGVRTRALLVRDFFPTIPDDAWRIVKDILSMLLSIDKLKDLETFKDIIFEYNHRIAYMCLVFEKGTYVIKNNINYLYKFRSEIPDWVLFIQVMLRVIDSCPESKAYYTVYQKQTFSEDFREYLDMFFPIGIFVDQYGNLVPANINKTNYDRDGTITTQNSITGFNNKNHDDDNTETMAGHKNKTNTDSIVNALITLDSPMKKQKVYESEHETKNKNVI